MGFLFIASPCIQIKVTWLTSKKGNSFQQPSLWIDIMETLTWVPAFFLLTSSDNDNPNS